MRWPFVSRELYDTAVAHANQNAGDYVTAVAGFSARLDAAEARYDALLDKYHALAHPAPAVTVATVPAVTLMPSEPDPVRDCIRDESNGDHRLAQHLRSHANELRRQGKQPADIVTALRAWETVGLDLGALG